MVFSAAILLCPVFSPAFWGLYIAAGLSFLMKHQTGRDFAFTAEMAATVTVIRVTINECTAKARARG